MINLFPEKRWAISFWQNLCIFFKTLIFSPVQYFISCASTAMWDEDELVIYIIFGLSSLLALVSFFLTYNSACTLDAPKGCLHNFCFWTFVNIFKYWWWREILKKILVSSKATKKGGIMVAMRWLLLWMHNIKYATLSFTQPLIDLISYTMLCEIFFLLMVVVVVHLLCCLSWPEAVILPPRDVVGLWFSLFTFVTWLGFLFAQERVKTEKRTQRWWWAGNRRWNFLSPSLELVLMLPFHSSHL